MGNLTVLVIMLIVFLPFLLGIIVTIWNFIENKKRIKAGGNKSENTKQK